MTKGVAMVKRNMDVKSRNVSIIKGATQYFARGLRLNELTF